MKRTPTLSVIIVTKNRADLLMLALSSLVGQTEKEDEIIIVDASTDRTPEVVRSFTGHLPIRYVRFTPPGYPLFYNKGAEVARGDILVFFTDDCIAHHNFLDHIRAAHTRHPDSVIQGMTRSIPKGNLYADIMGDHYHNWLTTMALPGGLMRAYDNKNASMPRKLFWRYGGLSKTMTKGSEDIEYGLRLKRHGVKIFFDRSIIASHRERTTLRGFLTQHYRFAASEGSLDRILPQNERLGLIPRKKLLLHIRSFMKREQHFLQARKFSKVVTLPALYIVLACLRIWGYATNR